MIEAELSRVILDGMGCTGIAVLMFCRAVHMSRATTWPPIRLAVFLGACAAVAGLYSVARGRVPDWPDVLMALAWLSMLLAASRAWAHGQPPEYTRPAALDAVEPFRPSSLTRP